MRVVWVCDMSDPTIRRHLRFCRWTPLALVRRLTGKDRNYDHSIWMSNAVREFKGCGDVEIHVISQHKGICGVREFEDGGVHYHIFRPEDDNLLSLLKSRLSGKFRTSYRKNTRTILRLIRKIKPDLIHYIGAESPRYGESALSLPSDIPLIVSLQTLMCDPDFLRNYPIAKQEYDYRAGLEIAVIRRADYVATTIEHFRRIIRRDIGEVKFLDMTLAVGEPASAPSDHPKSYDFVYFAANISKAVDYALEAFARARRRHGDITLHVIGDFSESLMADIMLRMERLGIDGGVDFTGKLPSHDDVIREIRKARFAVLPLKIDLCSNTVREAMANGIPVVTTVTPCTPDLNSDRESVLLSEKGDFDAMADNMCRLLEDADLAAALGSNGVKTVGEQFDNAKAMREWRENYRNILKRQ